MVICIDDDDDVYHYNQKPSVSCLNQRTVGGGKARILQDKLVLVCRDVDFDADVDVDADADADADVDVGVGVGVDEDDDEIKVFDLHLKPTLAHNSALLVVTSGPTGE